MDSDICDCVELSAPHYGRSHQNQPEYLHPILILLPLPVNILLLFALPMRFSSLIIPRLYYPTTLKPLSSLTRSINS